MFAILPLYNIEFWKPLRGRCAFFFPTPNLMSLCHLANTPLIYTRITGSTSQIGHVLSFTFSLTIKQVIWVHFVVLAVIVSENVFFSPFSRTTCLLQLTGCNLTLQLNKDRNYTYMSEKVWFSTFRNHWTSTTFIKGLISIKMANKLKFMSSWKCQLAVDGRTVMHKGVLLVASSGCCCVIWLLVIVF